MKTCLKCTRRQAIQDVDDFLFIQRDLALQHFLTYGPFAENGCRQNNFALWARILDRIKGLQLSAFMVDCFFYKQRFLIFIFVLSRMRSL